MAKIKSVLKLNVVEMTYSKFLSKDYETLFNLIQTGAVNLICFMDNKGDGETEFYYRSMHVAKNVNDFGSIWLGFIETNDPEEEKREKYISFCKRENLTYINPNVF